VHNFTSGQQAKEEGLPIPSPPRPEMSIYRNYFPNLPPYQQLLDSSQPTLLKAALFLDSIFPRKGLANTPVRITSKWAAARKGAALEVTSSGSPVGPAKGTACSTHDVSPCGFKSRQIVADRYVLLHQIGRDGIGSVYLCEDLFLGQKFAIKILHSKFKQSKPELQSLLNETRIVTKLSHPNIARVFHFYIRDGVCFNLQEYIKGRNLGEVLEDKPGGKLPEKDVLDIASSLVEALRYAHGEGVIHRDLNADNILLDENGVVKLLDFGMAACKITSSETEPGSFTKFSSTPYYMSPEHWEDLELVDHRSDIYSLGVLLYKLLSGSYPFQGYSIEALRKAQLTKRPGMIPDISERMMSLILRCLEPSPSKRWQDIPTVAYRLEQTKDTAARAGFTR
jgi:serine/threonine protein kinase